MRLWNKKKCLVLFLIILMTLVSIGASSADESFNSKNLTTIDNGTVNGGLYSDVFYGFDNDDVNIDYSDTIIKADNFTAKNITQTTDNYTSNTTSSDTAQTKSNKSVIEDVNFDDTNVTYYFKPLKDDLTVNSAYLISGIYIGNMRTDYPIDVTLTFNDNILVNKTLSSTYSQESYVQLDDNITRVTSDYVLVYDVTSLVDLDYNKVKILLENSSFARVKMSTLIISYNQSVDSGDSYYYSINVGHDVANTDTYTGQTVFNSLPIGTDVNSAQLSNYYLASTDGMYSFNDNILAGSTPQAGYAGVNTWDVTDTYLLGENNIFKYSKSGAYYKIIAATMLVNYTTTKKCADLSVEDILVNNSTTGQIALDDANNITIKLMNKGNLFADDINITIKINNQIITKHIESLDANTATEFTITYSTDDDAENVSLNVFIDEAESIDDLNRSNNLLNKTFATKYTKLSDLSIENIVIEGYEVNKTSTITLSVKNNGLKQSQKAVISLNITQDNKTVAILNQTMNALDVNNTDNITFKWTAANLGEYTIDVTITQLNNSLELDTSNNHEKTSIIITNSSEKLIFIISDTTGVNLINEASKSILNSYAGLVNIQIRTNDQIGSMTQKQLSEYIKNSDIFIGDWLNTGSFEKIKSIIDDENNITNNKRDKIVLIVEPPVSSMSNSAELISYSTFIHNNVDKIARIKDFSLTQLIEYYQNTTRGTSYEKVYSYINNSSLPELFNKAVLYKDMSNVEAYKNELLWLLNSLDSNTFNLSYAQPLSRLNTPDYGIYREKWYSYIDEEGNWHSGIDDYLKDYCIEGQSTVGLLESKMYVESQKLQPYYAIINQLESEGLNVIPVVAYGATDEQLNIMLKSFTNASNLTSLLENPQSYNIRIDALINMVAYGLGGSDFGYITSFFNSLNVPILKAVHSDYMTNAEYELSKTGLDAISGDKWWHITISESQGAITPIFVGGYESIINNITGASISGYVPHEGNIELLSSSVYNWILLKTLSNSEKKIALIYYNYPPGKQNIGASYLDPVNSVLNLLNILKDNGYNVKNIPRNSTILLAQMLSQGTNVANWANGLVDTMVNNNNNSLQEIIGYQENNTYQIDLTQLSQEEIDALIDTPGVILYPVDEFKQWFDTLSDINKLSITEGPVSYIGELAKKIVLYKSNESSIIENFHEGIVDLIPANMTNTAKPMLANIISLLKEYVLTRNTSYYDEYTLLRDEFRALNISGLSGWGEFPGNIMVVTRNDTQYFVLPGVQYGNVFIGPEPQRGWEGNAEQLYHNSIVPPHYQYLAFYAYLQQKNYNAMVFIGRHATHEWMSGKEVLCSNDDFTTILTGGVPQIYFYITDGISEGLTAKRRGSAVLISHLTPPITFTTLYGNLSSLQKLVLDYQSNEVNKTEIIESIKNLIVENDYDEEIGINVTDISDSELIDTVNAYLESILNTMYPYGVHVLGEKWSNDEISLLVTSMLSVDYEYTNAGDTTSLLNEISLIVYNKSYSSLSELAKNDIQQKSIQVVNYLIENGKESTIENITDNPGAGLEYSLDLALKYIDDINSSVDEEINSFLNALNAGYIEPGTGDDPVNNPLSVPTGKNIYQDQAAEIPTSDAWIKSENLTNTLLETINNTTKKVVVGIWDTETARDNGRLISVVLRLIGVKPVWTDSPSAGSGGKKLKETPEYVELENLTRLEGWDKKRIDVTVVLDGNFRDLYSRQLALMDKGFRIALARSYYTIINNKSLVDEYGNNLTTALNSVMETIGYYGIYNESLDDNAVAYDWVEDFKYYMSINMTPEDAGEYAITRIFAPPDNDYGALISQAVRQSWTFDDKADLAAKYLKRMAYMYSNVNWGAYNTEVLARALNSTVNLFTSRNTNLYGIVDNDDYFDYWGGLYNLMGVINYEAPSFNILIYGSDASAKILNLDEFLNKELNSRYYNPEWIKSMMNESYSGAGYMSKFVSNLHGWSWTSDSVENWMYDKIVKVYLDDMYNIGVDKFLSSGYNSYAFISITGTLLTSAYEGHWKTNDETLRKVANKWANLVIDNGVACCDCSCGNILMMDWSLKFINPDIMSQFKAKLYQATQNKIFFEDGMSSNPNSTGDDPNQTGNGTSDVNGGPSNPDSGNTPGDVSGPSVGPTNTTNISDNLNESSNTNSSQQSTTDNTSRENTNVTGASEQLSGVEDENQISDEGSSNVGDYASSSSDSIMDNSGVSVSTVEATSVVSGSVSDSESEIYELKEAKKGSAITDSAMSFIAVLFVMVFVVCIGYGYYKRNKDL